MDPKITYTRCCEHVHACRQKVVVTLPGGVKVTSQTAIEWSVDPNGILWLKGPGGATVGTFRDWSGVHYAAVSA